MLNTHTHKLIKIKNRGREVEVVKVKFSGALCLFLHGDGGPYCLGGRGAPYCLGGRGALTA